jgi:hypothetical protein
MDLLVKKQTSANKIDSQIKAVSRQCDTGSIAEYGKNVDERVR